MSLASYWLQAGLYLVALHRYLQVKMQDYQIEQHLGGATYLYLRGMNGEAEQGIITGNLASSLSFVLMPFWGILLRIK